MAFRFYHLAVVFSAAVVAGQSTTGDDVGLVQRALTITEASSNRTAAAAQLAWKLASVLRTIDKGLKDLAPTGALDSTAAFARHVAKKNWGTVPQKPVVTRDDFEALRDSMQKTGMPVALQGAGEEEEEQAEEAQEAEEEEQEEDSLHLAAGAGAVAAVSPTPAPPTTTRHVGEDYSAFEKFFECTRNEAIPAADKIIGIVNGIISTRGNCKEQTGASGRRDCAKDVTGLMGDIMGLTMLLPQMPQNCFFQDCSSPNNFNTKMAPVLAASAGVEQVLGMMTGIGNVDAHCYSKAPSTIAAHEALVERYPLNLYWIMKPILFANSAFDASVMATQFAEEFHYSICGSLAAFAGDLLALIESQYDLKAHQEAYRAGALSQSSALACASGLTKMLSTIPGVIGTVCGFEACKEGESQAEAIKEKLEE